jgi:hypothetical protein
MADIPLWLIYAWFIGIPLGILVWRWRLRVTFVNEFTGDSRFVVQGGALGWPRVHFKHPRLAAELQPGTVGVGKYRQAVWRCHVGNVRLARRLRLRLSESGWQRSVASLVGRAVQSGDPAFDRDFVATGNDDALIRAVLGHGAVKAAVSRVFSERLIQSCELDPQGLSVRLKRSGLDAEEAKTILMRVVALAEALDAAVAVKPVGRQSEGELPSAAASSGSPVAVRSE